MQYVSEIAVTKYKQNGRSVIKHCERSEQHEIDQFETEGTRGTRYVVKYYQVLSFNDFLKNFADLLCAQNNFLRNPSHELRSVCFSPLKLALESKKSKLVSLALSGLNVSKCVILLIKPEHLIRY